MSIYTEDQLEGMSSEELKEALLTTSTSLKKANTKIATNKQSSATLNEDAVNTLVEKKLEEININNTYNNIITKNSIPEDKQGRVKDLMASGLSTEEVLGALGLGNQNSSQGEYVTPSHQTIAKKNVTAKITFDAYSQLSPIDQNNYWNTKTSEGLKASDFFISE